jgi:hypothetical protein
VSTIIRGFANSDENEGELLFSKARGLSWVLYEERAPGWLVCSFMQGAMARVIRLQKLSRSDDTPMAARRDSQQIFRGPASHDDVSAVACKTLSEFAHHDCRSLPTTHGPTGLVYPRQTWNGRRSPDFRSLSDCAEADGKPKSRRPRLGGKRARGNYRSSSRLDLSSPSTVSRAKVN